MTKLINMNISIRLFKMVESNGNNQFFVYVVNEDVFKSVVVGGHLNICCYQSKHFDFNNKEPIERAVYQTIELLRFYGMSSSDLEIINFTDSESLIVKETFKFWRFE